MSKDRGDTKANDDPGSDVEQYIVKDPQKFALNMARVMEEAGKAAAAWSGPRQKGEAHDAVSEPVVDLVKTFSKLTEYWLSDPSRALEAQTRLFSGYMGIWANSLRKWGGEPGAGAWSSAPEIVPEKGDKRFQDPEWGRNAFFDFLMQFYLATARWAGDLVEHADGLDDQTRHKARFYVKQIANAISPSNFVLTNPEILRETVATSGENLVRGMRMLKEDIEAGKGDLRLRQADPTRFKVGENLANTPGKVIARNEIAEIIQYEPSTAKVFRRPLLICPPWINKFYILDLNREKSFIRWAVEQGHTVFVISWVNPDERHGRKDWNAYIEEGVGFALDTVEAAAGKAKINAVGYCVGGTLLSAALALFAREGDERIASATFFATQVDFLHAGDLKIFVDEPQINALEKAMDTKGYLEGTKMATAFNMLRSGDLIWPYVINNYLRGRDPLPFDLLYWNSDSTRMAAANHSFYLRNCYLDNNLSQDRMELGGAPVSLRDITIPIYNLATREDHIAPALSVFEGSKHFGGPVEFVLSGSGHIAGVVNPPGLGKYQYWTGGAPAGQYEDWLAAATETPGSWWPHWQAWVEALDDKRVKARKAGGTRLAPLADAPGEYVRARS